MLDGAFCRSLFVLVILLAPSALSAAPTPALSSAFSLGAQDVTDIALDATGEYAVGVVKVDPTKLSLIPGEPRHDDIYPCHFGPVTAVGISGQGCQSPGRRHSTVDTSLSDKQVVDLTGYLVSGGRTWRFAVGGPSAQLSLWANTEDRVLWTRTLSGNQPVVAVAVAPDASRVVAGTAASAGSGRIFVYDSAGKYQWDYNLSGTTRPTAIDYAGSGNLAVVGTTTSILFLKPAGAKPQSLAEVSPIETGAAVTDVVVSHDGRAAVVGTTQGVYYVPIKADGAPESLRSFRSLTDGASKVALSKNGERFAAASGNSIHFFRHLDSSLIAESIGQPYDAGAAVSGLAYTADGSLLVAIAGNRVFGFGPARTAPIWSFDATLSENGGLDGPLTHVAVSDGGERILVAGKTELMPYRTVVSATGRFVQQQGLEVVPGTTARLSLTVTNTGSVPDNYTFIPRFPPGWHGRGPEPVALDPEESATLNLTLDVPQGQTPGFYGVEVEVRSSALQAAGRQHVAVAGPALNFTIARRIELNVTTAEDRLTSLRPGGSQVLPVTVRNLGNALGVVNLSATQLTSRGGSWTLRFADDQVEIPAGGQVTVNLDVIAPEDAASGDRNDITIRAREGATAEATKVVTAFVDPRFSAELTPDNETAKYEFAPTELKAIRVTVVNNGNTDDTFNVSFSVTPADVASDWRVTVDKSQLAIPRGETRTVTATVRPIVAEPRDASLLVRAVSLGSAETVDDTLTLALVAKPQPQEGEKNPLPAPGAPLVVALGALAALAARRLGGRRE